MSENNKTSDFTDKSSTSTSTTDAASVSTVIPGYIHIYDNGELKLVPVHHAIATLTEQQKQLSNFVNRLDEVECYGKDFNNVLKETFKINSELLGKYRKLLNAVKWGFIIFLIFSTLILAIPLWLFLTQFDANKSIQVLEYTLRWIVGIYGLSSFFGLLIFIFSSVWTSKHLEDIVKRVERLENPYFNKGK